MKLPYSYVLDGEEIVVREEKADVVRNIFEYVVIPFKQPEEKPGL